MAYKHVVIAIAYFSTQGAWGMCLNKQTIYFHVTAGQFNLLGSFDPVPSVSKIQSAVLSGKMPKVISHYGVIPPLMDESLEGLTPFSSEPNLKAEADAFLSQAFSQSVSTVEPSLSTTSYNTTTTSSGQPSCFTWSKKSDYPDN